MRIEAPYLPIVYIRGFAATMAEIEETVATPYMGFNLGSTKIRQDAGGRIVRFIFESPLLRLIKDEGYVDAYSGGDLPPPGARVPAKSVWIFRYYESASEELGAGARRRMPELAADLRRFILRIREHVCGDDAEARASFKVHLVAHSMGGLIARCYLQNLCWNGSRDAETDAALELAGAPVDPLVDKVFTYGTPHNGIEMLDLNVPDLGGLDAYHVRNFNRDVMRGYLDLPPDAERVDSLNGRFPPQRFFCFIGTNHRDYKAFFGLSKRATGPMSDGLVMIRNASVQGAPRAFAYRSHSGHYGIVNSEEGYQNLRRFLFGDLRVDVRLQVHELLLPPNVQRLKDEGAKIRAAYNIESSARVRGGNVFLTERRVAQESAIRRGYDELVKDGKAVYLFSGCLARSAKTEGSRDTALAFAVRIGIEVPLYEVDNRFWFDDHFEGGHLFDEVITFHLRPGRDRTTVRYGLASRDGLGEAPHMAERTEREDGGVDVAVPLGFKQGTARPPRPSLRGTLLVSATPWR